MSTTLGTVCRVDRAPRCDVSRCALLPWRLCCPVRPLSRPLSAAGATGHWPPHPRPRPRARPDARCCCSGRAGGRWPQTPYSRLVQACRRAGVLACGVIGMSLMCPPGLDRPAEVRERRGTQYLGGYHALRLAACVPYMGCIRVLELGMTGIIDLRYRCGPWRWRCSRRAKGPDVMLRCLGRSTCNGERGLAPSSHLPRG